MIKNPYSSKAPLVAKDDTPSSPLFPLLKDQNKGIRVRLVGITSATKGALDNKVTPDFRIINVNDMYMVEYQQFAICNFWKREAQNFLKSSETAILSYIKLFLGGALRKSGEVTPRFSCYNWLFLSFMEEILKVKSLLIV